MAIKACQGNMGLMQGDCITPEPHLIKVHISTSNIRERGRARYDTRAPQRVNSPKSKLQ